ncbi:MAG: radical SAM protein, partial [Phycisphaerae bacterium]
MPSTSRAADVARDSAKRRDEYTDEWILARRPPKNAVDPSRPYAFLLEQEPTAHGCIESVATIFLTNKECPFRCLMCDLWKNTTDEPVAPGMIRRQIEWALARLEPARHIKLYNSGNFFDPQAIPETDYPSIAEVVSQFDTVIVESHPLMVGRRCFAFNDMVDADVHVAMGLETVHPDVLGKLNKHMTLNDFARAVGRLKAHGMEARAFILLRPPFLNEPEGVLWAKRSMDYAFDVGVECCAIIPTRGGNGAMES